MKRVEKPWGIEFWLEQNDKYVFKMIFIEAGCKLSKQYHKQKHETMMFVGGESILTIGDTTYKPPAYVDEKNLDKKIFVIPPNTIHRIEAITPTIIYEVSTPEVDDVVRLEDDYGRL